MIKAISISIPEPCHEDWDKMTPNEKGRFCSLCAKTVVDFSSMTDNQVLHYLLDKRDQKICGRALPEQLDTPMALPLAPKRRIKWYLNIAAAFTLLFAKNSTAQQKEPVKTTTEPGKKKDPILLKGNIATRPVVEEKVKIISGNVTDAEGNPVPFAALKVMDSSATTVSDTNGFFLMKVKKGDKVEVVCNNYVSASFTVADTFRYNPSLQKVNNAPVTMVLGEVAIIRKYPDQPYVNAIIYLKEEGTNRPVPNGLIKVYSNRGYGLPMKKKKEGKFKIEKIVPGLRYTLTVEALGYETVEYPLGSEFGNRKELVREIYLRKSKSKMPEVEKLIAEKALRLSMDTTPIKEIKPVPTVNEALQGRVGGLLITTTYVLPVTSTEPALAINQPADLHAVNIYPNPVPRGNTMQLLWVMKQKGPHIVLVNDAAGLLVWQQQVLSPAKNSKTTIPVNAGWSAGIYRLRIVNESGKVISENSFIVQ